MTDLNLKQEDVKVHPSCPKPFQYMLSQQLHTPYALSRKFFDKYAPYFGAALKAYPGVYLLNIPGLRPDTAASYMRRVRKAKHKYGYQHSSIDDEKFALEANNISMAIFEDGVRLGTPDNIFEETIVNIASELLTIEVQERDFVTIMTIVALQARRILHPAPVFVVTLSPEWAAKVTANQPDVLVEQIGTSDRYRIL